MDLPGWSMRLGSCDRRTNGKRFTCRSFWGAELGRQLGRLDRCGRFFSFKFVDSLPKMEGPLEKKGQKVRKVIASSSQDVEHPRKECDVESFDHVIYTVFK